MKHKHSFFPTSKVRRRMQMRFRAGAKPRNLQDCCSSRTRFASPRVRRPQEDPQSLAQGSAMKYERGETGACHHVWWWARWPGTSKAGALQKETTETQPQGPPAAPGAVFPPEGSPTGTGTRTPAVLGTVVPLQKFTGSERNVVWRTTKRSPSPGKSDVSRAGTLF